MNAGETEGQDAREYEKLPDESFAHVKRTTLYAAEGINVYVLVGRLHMFKNKLDFLSQSFFQTLNS